MRPQKHPLKGGLEDEVNDERETIGDQSDAREI
jgi:hypothetical protein